MNIRYAKLTIEDIVKISCTDDEVDALIDVFEYTLKRMSTLTRKACFELKDFYSAKKAGIDGFDMTIIRDEIMGQTQWSGVFLNGDKELNIMGTFSEE